MTKEGKEDPKNAVPNTALLLRMLLRKRNKKKDESSKSELHQRPKKHSEKSPHPSPSPDGQKNASCESVSPAVVGRGSSTPTNDEVRGSAETVCVKTSVDKKKSEKAPKKEKTKDEAYDPGLQSTKFEVVKGGVRPAHTKMRKRNIMMDEKSKLNHMELEILREKIKKQEHQIRELKQETTQLKELNEKLSTKPGISQTDSGESAQSTLTERAQTALTSAATAQPTTSKQPAGPKKNDGDSSTKSGKEPKDKKKTKEEDSVGLISSTYL